MSICLVSILASVFAALLVWLRHRRRESNDALDVECGYPVPTGFWLPRLWWIPLVSVEWTWEQPAARVRNVARGNRVYEEVIANRRGVVGAIVRRIRSSYLATY